MRCFPLSTDARVRVNANHRLLCRFNEKSCVSQERVSYSSLSFTSATEQAATLSCIGRLIQSASLHSL